MVLIIYTLQTYKPNPDSEELAWDVHFWIGTKSTQVFSIYAKVYLIDLTYTKLFPYMCFILLAFNLYFNIE